MKLRYELFAVLLAVYNASAFANPAKIEGGGPFAAPIIADHTTLPGDVPFGSIVFDYTAGAFQGLTNSGSWVALSNPVGSNSIVSLGTTERSERIMFGGNGGNVASPVNGTAATCTNGGGTSCLIYSESGGIGTSGWVNTNGVTRTAAGVYTITFNAGVWSSAPICVANCHQVGNKGLVPSVFTASSSAISLTCFDSTAVANADAAVNVVCQGAR